MISITFADGTWGMTGNEVEYHALNPIEGPLGGKGFSRYVTREDIDALYKLDCNRVISIERQEYFFSETKVIKEWIVEMERE